MKAIDTIQLKDLREHLKNNPTCYHYFIYDREIVGCTQNWWYYDIQGGCYLGHPETEVIVKKEGD